MSQNSQKKDLNSEQLFYKGESKTPLIFLHGWGHSLEVIKPLAQLLSSEFEVHLIDLPGHGLSSAPDTVWGMQDFARCVEKYLDEKGLSQVVMIGHSFGGKTSMKLASLVPEKIQKLVLINSSGVRPKRTFKKKMRIFFISKLRTIVKFLDRFLNLDIFRSWFVPKFASPDYLNAGPMLRTFVKTVNEDLSEIMPSINCPTLLLWGELDTETPLEMGRRFEKLLPNSRLVVLKGKDHVPFLGAGAHQCAVSIKRFLKS